MGNGDRQPRRQSNHPNNGQYYNNNRGRGSYRGGRGQGQRRGQHGSDPNRIAFAQGQMGGQSQAPIS
ncbi:hypothetical protein N7499_004826 [Penicillium canescens]|uniref:Uncharacterized protein n=2 Tax=Penicillium canescens TaxID=5083 RepID=A0AAD6N362_PENCN|nr:hypothetical protein N7522_004790 [Penicillium canescens]KAJ6026727.1 hypothetical protein N7460_011544 [Penicillium canescens]KAJ6085197.1 hypothetical protein N7499_004826 [Penicillium canescens]